jgi:DMSO reductase family type II enzyme heme b subunit
MRRLSVCLAVIGSLVAAGCRKAPVRTAEVVAVHSASLPLDPADRAWNAAPLHVAKLMLQDLVEPRLMKPSTTEVQVQALTNGTELAFRLAWADATRNDLADSGRFVDACAVQLPRDLSPEPPDPQMGQQGRPVEVTFWRSDWQAWVNGRGDTIREIHPNASIDHYPFEAGSLEAGSQGQREMARRYAPAQALGNRRAGPRDSPVEDLISEGPGTLTPAPAATSRGNGIRTRDGWAVVLSRRVPAGLVPRARTQVAFAVWEGSSREVGARKMRSGWIPLLMQEAK